MMRIMNWVGGILIIAFFAWLVYAVNTYDNVPINENTKLMMKYLEKTYNEKFVLEEYLKGSKLFPKFLGSDMIRVHPKKDENIPFYTIMSVDKKSFEDFYPEALYGHAFTLKYQDKILKSDERKKYVQMHTQNKTLNTHKEFVALPLDQVVSKDIALDMVYCYVVVAVDDNFEVNKEAKLLADTYAQLKEATGGDFIMNVNFVAEKNFDSAVEMMRMGHAYSVDLSLIEEGFRGNLIFQRDFEPRDLKYFDDYLNLYY